MTVNATTSAVLIPGTGTTSVLPFSWQIAQASDLIVMTQVVATGVIATLALGTGYTVQGAGIATGGTVTLTAGNLPTGTNAFIASDPVELQLLLLSQANNANQADLMAALDLLTRMVQANRRVANNALRIPLTESLAGLNTVLPPAAARALQFPAFDAAGNLIVAPGVTTTSLPATVILQTVVNVAALRAIAVALGDGQTFSVEGYYTAGDGGGGLFYWSAGSAAAENGGTVIKGIPTTGRFLRLYEKNTYDPRWFGAYGDGTSHPLSANFATLAAAQAIYPFAVALTDETDSTAWQAAMNAVTSAGGRIVGTDGDYQITVGGADDITARAVDMPSNVFVDMSRNCILRATATNQQHYSILRALGKNNVRLSGGYLIGDRSIHIGSGGEWGFGVAMIGCTYFWIENLRAVNCWGDGIFIGRSGIYTTPADKFLVAGCVCDNNRRQGCSVTLARSGMLAFNHFTNTAGTAPQSGLDLENDFTDVDWQVHVMGNECSGNAGDGITNLVSGTILEGNICLSNAGAGIACKYNNATAISRVTVTGNRSEGNLRGIWLVGCSDSTVQGNKIKTSGLYGIECDGTTFSAADNVFTGNRISASTSIAAFFETCPGTTFTGNSVKDNSDHGVRALASSYSTFTGNTISRNGKAGLVLNGCLQCVVEANPMYGNGTVDNTLGHIYFENGSRYNTVRNNNLTANGTAPNFGIQVSDAGSDNNDFYGNNMVAAGSTQPFKIAAAAQNFGINTLVAVGNPIPSYQAYAGMRYEVAQPGSGVVTEYVCVTAGTPGTWRQHGGVAVKGVTGSRPSLGTSDVGVPYLDTTLAANGKPIVWTGTQWVDSTGTAV